MKYTYKPSGVCSISIEIVINDLGIIDDIKFIGGCSGNAQGVAALVKGSRPEAVINKLKGIKCGYRNTSCPDQLAKALEQAGRQY